MNIDYSIVATSSGKFFEFAFNGKPVTVRESDEYWNLTEMAKAAKKRLGNFLRLQSTRDYLEELVRELNQSNACSNFVYVNPDPEPSLLIYEQGENLTLKPIVEVADIIGGQKASYGHPLVALEFARWISPKFAIFSNKVILKLATVGYVSLQEELALLRGENESLKYQRDTVLELSRQSSPWRNDYIEDPDDDEYLGPVPH